MRAEDGWVIADIAQDTDAIEDVAFELENTTPPGFTESPALVAKLQAVSQSLRHTLAIMRAHARDFDRGAGSTAEACRECDSGDIRCANCGTGVPKSVTP